MYGRMRLCRSRKKPISVWSRVWGGELSIGCRAWSWPPKFGQPGDLRRVGRTPAFPAQGPSICWSRAGRRRPLREPESGEKHVRGGQQRVNQQAPRSREKGMPPRGRSKRACMARACGARLRRASETTLRLIHKQRNTTIIATTTTRATRCRCQTRDPSGVPSPPAAVRKPGILRASGGLVRRGRGVEASRPSWAGRTRHARRPGRTSRGARAPGRSCSPPHRRPRRCRARGRARPPPRPCFPRGKRARGPTTAPGADKIAPRGRPKRACSLGPERFAPWR